MIKSNIGKGQIYAGDTPLFSSIVVEQTGLMQLTVKAGAFRSTGQARILDGVHAELIAAGKAEKMADGRTRAWLQDTNGNPVDKAKTHTLPADEVLNIISDVTFDTLYEIDLVTDGTQVTVLMRSKLDDEIEAYADLPVGWERAHDLIYEFRVPAGASDISSIDIFVLEVLPGFPPGTGAADWLTQKGSV